MKKRKILILSVSGIGNTILQSPLINAILDSELYETDILFGNRGMLAVYGDNPKIHNSYILPSGVSNKLKLIFRLLMNRYEYSVVCFPSNKPEFHILPFLIGVGKRISHSYETSPVSNLQFLSNRKVIAQRGLHDTEQNLLLLKRLDLPAPEIVKTTFHISGKNREFADSYIESTAFPRKSTIIGIHPGSNKGQREKRWPGNHFRTLINRLNHEKKKVLLFSGPDDAEDVKFIYDGIEDTSSCVIVSQPDLNNTAAIIEKCNLFLSTDSGLGHMATAVRVPTISLFGPADKTRVTPYGEISVPLSLNLDCSPCMKYPFDTMKSGIHCIYKNSESFKCLKELSPDSVYNEITKLLK